MDRGYVKLWRKTLDSQVFQNEGLLKVWIWCLLKANHDGRWVTVDTGRGKTQVWINPGQFIFGRDSASTELNANPSTLWKRMLRLKKLQNVDIESNSKFSTVSITNWGTYQHQNSESNSKSNSQVTAKEQPSNTNKNVKNKDNPPTPQPDKPKSISPRKGAYPEIDELLKFYQQTINPQNASLSRARHNISLIIKTIPLEDLYQAVRNYAAKSNGRERQYKKDPANFFGRNEPYYEDFLPGQFQQEVSRYVT